MQTKIIAALALVLVTAIVLMTLSENSDSRVASQLAQRHTQQIDSLPRASGPASAASEVQLTRRLHARIESEGDDWIVEDFATGERLHLPFKPAADADAGAAAGVSADLVTKSSDHEPNAMGFVGAEACAACHQEKYLSFVETAHHLTSAAVGATNVQGSLAAPKNRLAISDSELVIDVREHEDGFAQQIRWDGWQCTIPMDVVTGSGKTGRTFLFWNDESLFQSYVSYLSGTRDWIPSPGFEDQVTYSRPIRTGCLECHITYIEPRRSSNAYHRDSAIWGISCERCHSPGQDHVKYHEANPDAKKAMFISHPVGLSRQSQLDICGQCHSGSFKLTGEPFGYRPGDDPDEHRQMIAEDSTGLGGIHTSNQLTRLSMSKCFESSEMTCTTCHNPHQNERGKSDVFNARCVSCHEPTSCGMSSKLELAELTTGCVSCHMPIGANEGMTLKASSGDFSVQMIDHYIRINR